MMRRDAGGPPAQWPAPGQTDPPPPPHVRQGGKRQRPLARIGPWQEMKVQLRYCDSASFPSISCHQAG